MKNVLHIAKDFNLASGVTRYVSTLFKLFKDDKDFRLHLIVNRGDAIESNQDSGFLIKVIPFEVGIKGLPGFLSTKKNIETYCVKNEIDILHTDKLFLLITMHLCKLFIDEYIPFVLMQEYSC